MNRGKICLKFLFVVLFSMIILFISCNNENKENTLNTNGGETIINNSLETKKENDLIKINDNQTEENPENKEENEKPVGDNPEEKPIGDNPEGKPTRDNPEEKPIGDNPEEKSTGDNPEEKPTGDNPENKEQGDQPTPEFTRPRVSNDLETLIKYINLNKRSFINGYGYLDIEKKYFCYYNIPVTGPLYQIKYSSVKDSMLIDPYILILGSVYTDELGNMNSSSNPGVAGASFTFEFKCYGFEENIAMEDLQFETTEVEENKYYIKFYSDNMLSIEFSFYTTLEVDFDWFVEFIKNNTNLSD